MIIIDYPPGGLGHFLAQCVRGTIIEDAIGHLSFHDREDPAYDYFLADSKESFFEKLPLHEPTSDLMICHSWGQLASIKKKYPDSYIVQVVVKDRIDIHINNVYRKAVRGSKKSILEFFEHLNQHWDRVSVSSATRVDIALRYVRSAMASMEHWYYAPDPSADAHIIFDNLYLDIESMDKELKKIGSKSDTRVAWNVLQRTQKLILDKVKLYPMVLNNLSEIDQNPNLDDIDKGIIIGMWVKSQCEKNQATELV